MIRIFRDNIKHYLIKQNKNNKIKKTKKVSKIHEKMKKMVKIHCVISKKVL